jgi:hypothetical protein
VNFRIHKIACWNLKTATGNEEIVKSETDEIRSNADAQVCRPQIVVLDEVGEIKDLVKDRHRGLRNSAGMINQDI